MSNRQLAKQLGVSHTLLNRKVKLGQLTQTHSAEAARAEIEANTRPKADGAFTGADDNFRKVATMERLERALLLKTKRLAAERNSLSRDEVQNLVADAVIALREHILNMVPQRADQMANELGVDVAKLKASLRKHLSSHMTEGIREMREGAVA